MSRPHFVLIHGGNGIECHAADLAPGLDAHGVEHAQLVGSKLA